MKRTAFAVVPLVVLFSTVVVSQLCNSANANPNWRPWGGTVISGLSIENKTYSQNNLYCIVDKPTSWKGYSLDGGANVTFVTGSYFSNLASGSHTLTVYANDTSGHMSASETIFFTIEESFPTALVMASSVTVADFCIGLGLLVYFKKRKH